MGRRIGTIFDHERGHLLEMLNRLPRRALLIAYANFPGYEFLNAIHASDRFFLVRAPHCPAGVDVFGVTFAKPKVMVLTVRPTAAATRRARRQYPSDLGYLDH